MTKYWARLTREQKRALLALGVLVVAGVCTGVPPDVQTVAAILLIVAGVVGDAPEPEAV